LPVVAKAQIPVGYAKVEVTGTFGPATWANVFYVFIGETARTPGQVITDVVTFLNNLYDTAINLARLSPRWVHQYTTVTYRDAEDSIVRLRVADAQVGTASGGDQDAQVAYLINWATGDPRRGGKPRQYIVGVPDSAMLDSARLDNSLIASINAGIVSWLVSGLSLPTPMQLVEMSFRNDKADRLTAVDYPIIGGTVNPVVATQRRRVNRLRI
jgi:hypothetical protein